MIVDGLKLALVGMSVVFLFLLFLIVAIQIVAKLLRPYTEKEEKQEMAVPLKKASIEKNKIDDSRLVAVIGAAISAHRARTQHLRGT
jgi:sodium pump decarboxylase gamma subunit